VHPRPQPRGTGGVARTADSAEGESGLVVFVPNALPGENVARGRVSHRAQRHLVAELITRHNDLADSPQNRLPSSLTDCGGCSVQHLVRQARRSGSRRCPGNPCAALAAEQSKEKRVRSFTAHGSRSDLQEPGSRGVVRLERT